MVAQKHLKTGWSTLLSVGNTVKYEMQKRLKVKG